MSSCECGCGQEVKPGRRFINGHNRRGIKLTSEHIVAISKALTGVPRTPEARAAISKAKTGVPLSPEHCTAMSAATLGVPHTSEAQLAADEAKRGVQLSPEWCAALSKSHIGHPVSEETRVAIATGRLNSNKVKTHNESMRGVPRLPEHIASMKKGMEESGMYENMRCGNDICEHHYIYDHADLSKNTVGMTRSDHSKLHHLLKRLGYIVPHINIK